MRRGEEEGRVSINTLHTTVHVYIRISHKHTHTTVSPHTHTPLTSPCVDGSWAEGLPHDGLTDVGGNEERYTTAGRDTVLNSKSQCTASPVTQPCNTSTSCFSAPSPPSPTHPDPSPYPFCNSSSSNRTTSPAITSWMMIRKQTPIPSSEGGPYIPVSTYTTAWPTVITIPNSFWAPLKRARSFGVSPTSRILAPASS